MATIAQNAPTTRIVKARDAVVHPLPYRLTAAEADRIIRVWLADEAETTGSITTRLPVRN